MTSQTVTPTLDISGTARIPFGRLVLVELRKSYDTRASFWLLATIGILVTLVETLMLIVTVVTDEPVEFGDFVGGAAFVTAVLLPVLGIMLVTAEWSQRTAMVTFALEPRRPLVIAAKAVVGIILTVATALGATTVGFVCNVLYGVLEGGADWTFGWNYFVGFLIVQSLAMLSGFALAALLLNTAAAIVIFFIYLYALPGLFSLLAFYVDWFADLQPWLDFQAAQTPLRDLSLNTGDEWGHLLVSGFVWLGIPLAVGLRRILRAEVK